MKGKGFRCLAAKLGWYLLTLFVVITFNFVLIRFMPGEPLERYLGMEDYYYLERYDPETLQEYAVKFGLDKSGWEQYTTYLSNILRGDWGYSYHYQSPVTGILKFRMGWSIVMMTPAVIISAILGICSGTLAGWRQKNLLGKLMTLLSMAFYVVPSYCLSMVILLIFSYYNNWFPVGGITSGGLNGWARFLDISYHLALPTLTLCISKVAYNHLIMKSCISQELVQDYPITAASRGLSQNQVLFRHVLPNAMLPMIVNLTAQAGAIISGSMMVEVIFNWQGMGNLIYESILNLDYPLLQGGLLITTIMVILSNILCDLICGLIDPRVREGLHHEA